MRAISLWQPWASLWLSPAKIHETRHWSTTYRGPLAVHAAKRYVKSVDAFLEKILEDEFGGHWAMDLPTGAIIGVVNIVDCVPTESLFQEEHYLKNLENDDYCCGNFAEGRFALKRSDVFHVLKQPIPCIGRQKFFQVPDELILPALQRAA